MARGTGGLAVLLAALGVMSGCAGTQDVLDPASIHLAPPGAVGSTEADAGAPAQAASPVQAEPGSTGGIAAPAESMGTAPAVIQASLGTSQPSLRLDPIVGSPPQATAPLMARFAEQARARGLSVATGADPAATAVVKGYLSTVEEDGGTTVLYVWDVYDGAGRRLHRIDGRETVRGATGWEQVPPETMRRIADAAVARIAAVLGSRQS